MLGLAVWIVAILAVIFGHIAKKEIAGNPGYTGSGMATAGLILGYIVIAIMVITFLVTGGLMLSLFTGSP